MTYSPVPIVRRMGDGSMIARDPIITPLVTALVFGSGTVFAGASLTVFGISAATVLTGAAIIGANYALSAINQPKKSVGAPASGVGEARAVNSAEARGSVQQSAPVERWVYGQARIGGAVFFIDDSKPPYLYLGLLYSGRQISGVRGLRISTNDIPIANFAFDQILLPLSVVGQDYVRPSSNRLVFSFGSGKTSQAIDPLLHGDFTNLDVGFRQRGIARGAFRFEFGDDANDFQALWGQGVSIPNPLIDVEGAPVFDPRDPAQFYPSDWRDAEEVAAAMATWRYSRNASLIQADWLGHPDGVNYPAGRIRWDEIARSADYDDEPVANKDGTSRPRHTIDGVVTLDQSPRTVMESMLTANQGFMVQDRGTGWVQSSIPRAPVLTIDDNLLMAGFDFQCDREKAQLVNTVRARFASSDREYQDSDAPILKRDDLIEEDGETLERTVRLPFTSDHRAVQNLEKRFLAEARLPRSLTCRLKLRAIGDDLKPACCVRVDSRWFPQLNAVYSVETMGFLDDFSGLSVALKEYDLTIPVDWTPQADEQDFVLPQLDIS